MIAWIAQFTAQAKAKTGKWPVIYTTADWWQECTGSTAQFGRDALWLAAFGGTAPAVPSPWLHWKFWQYNNNGSLPGIGRTDLDYFQPTSLLPALRPPPKPKPSKNRPTPHKHQKPKPKPKPKPHPNHQNLSKHYKPPKPLTHPSLRAATNAHS